MNTELMEQLNESFFKDNYKFHAIPFSQRMIEFITGLNRPRYILKNVETDEKEEYIIVGSTEADPLEGKISNESPIGAALLGRKKNEVVDAETPGGILQFKILKISKGL